MRNEFFKSILILICIIIYILYLYIKTSSKKKSMGTPKIIVKPSHEQKKFSFLLGFLCVISIILILSLSIDFDVDVYTKIKIINLKLHMPLFYTITFFLTWYFTKTLQPTIFYENCILYRGNCINWTDIYKTKRRSNTRLTVYYTDKINSRIDILHLETQRTMIDEIIVSKVKEKSN